MPPKGFHAQKSGQFANAGDAMRARMAQRPPSAPAGPPQILAPWARLAILCEALATIEPLADRAAKDAAHDLRGFLASLNPKAPRPDAGATGVYRWQTWARATIARWRAGFAPDAPDAEIAAQVWRLQNAFSGAAHRAMEILPPVGFSEHLQRTARQILGAASPRAALAALGKARELLFAAKDGTVGALRALRNKVATGTPAAPAAGPGKAAGAGAGVAAGAAAAAAGAAAGAAGGAAGAGAAAAMARDTPGGGATLALGAGALGAAALWFAFRRKKRAT